jgi:ABC-type multidrug transport system ATPase subunit
VTTPPAASPPLAPILAADSIEFAYGRRAVLHSAYVDAVAGQVTALVGVSGSGKTTLLEVLVGRRRAFRGQVRWAGARVARASLAKLARRGLAYAPSESWLSRRVSVGRQLALAASMWGGDAAGAARSAGVGDLGTRTPSQLSGGEQRLCELAMAAACRPAALVLDEPFRGLEPLHRESVGRFLVTQARAGVAVLFADHDAEQVRQVADRVFAIEDGRTRPVAGFRDRPIREWYHAWAGGDPYI